MRLRLALLEQNLAYRFGVSQPTISRIINGWIGVMATRLEFLIHWPEREQLRKTMPGCILDNFEKCAVILDCFEIFIEKPTDLTARAQTWSQYKHHNTVKVLLGMTPQGTISFISQPWGGRASDIHVTANSGLLIVCSALSNLNFLTLYNNSYNFFFLVFGLFFAFRQQYGQNHFFFVTFS
uniref:DDE Tnp4 domain-containing protein n=1 Tax=Clytia hemisphaerica TaxID=252671 RepID=A0A7M5X0V0_9CNID